MTEFMGEQMREFQCPKCGWYELDIEHTYLGGEFLQMKCERCKYRWKEQPLDKPLSPEMAKIRDAFLDQAHK